MENNTRKDTSRETAQQQPNESIRMSAFSWGEPSLALGGDQVKRMLRCGDILAEGARDMTHEWMDCAQEAMRRSFAGWRELAECRNLNDVFSNQEKLLRSEAELLAKSAARLTQQWTGTARDAAALFTETKTSA